MHRSRFKIYIKNVYCGNSTAYFITKFVTMGRFLISPIILKKEIAPQANLVCPILSLANTISTKMHIGLLTAKSMSSLS